MQNPAVVFARDSEGHIVFDNDQAKKPFAVTDPAVLRGMSGILQNRMQNEFGMRPGIR